MDPNVYFLPLPPKSDAQTVSRTAALLLQRLLTSEQIPLEKKIPLKLHFGEKGNRTYLPQECYLGVIELLEEKGCGLCYTETSVLYGGERFSRERHEKLAAAHGFTRLPVVIADGDHGEAARRLPVPRGKHFAYADIAEKLADAPQTVVLSHFKGHKLAGFGGAIKQLSMGFASKGGKMAMHLGVKPRIRRFLCKGCGLCAGRCHENAIQPEGKHYTIDSSRCVGCGACFAICRHHAVSILTWGGLWNALFGGKFFREKLVEYAAASHMGKHNIYLNFVCHVTSGCDCEPLPMRSCVPDVGVFASLDPVALDSACFDAVAKAGKRFRGSDQLDYAAKIGFGSRTYHLVPLTGSSDGDEK